MTYPYAPPPSADRPRLRGRTPLRLSFVFLALAVVAVVVGVVLLVRGYSSTINGFQRVTLSQGNKTVQLDAGDYVGYYEVPDDETRRAAVRFGVTDSSGQVVNISLYGRNGSSSSSVTYVTGGYHGEALFKFRIADSGRYVLNVSSTDAPSGARVAVGKSIAGTLVGGVLLVLAGVLLFIVFVVLLIVGLVKRSHSKRELANPYGYGPPPPPGYGGPPPPGYGPPGYGQPGYGGPPPPGYGG